LFCSDRGNENIEERAVQTIPKTILTILIFFGRMNSLLLWWKRFVLRNIVQDSYGGEYFKHAPLV
jgi:hypothetical protein